MLKNLLKKSLLAFTMAGLTQVATAQTHDISLNLAPIAFSNYSGNYSFNLNDNMSLGGVLGYQNLKVTTTLNGTSSEVSYGGFYVAPEFKYYFNPNDGNDGFFAGGYLKFRSMGTSGNAFTGLDKDGTTKDYDETSTGVSLGILLGRTWVTNFGLFFSTWTGAGYYLFDKTTYSNSFTPDPTFTVADNTPSMDLRVGLNIGYRIGR